MPFSVNNSLRIESRKLEVIDRKGPGREIVFANPDTRRSIWDLTVKYRHTPQKISRLLNVTQREIVTAWVARHFEEIDKAVAADRARRGPQPPAMIRRAA